MIWRWIQWRWINRGVLVEYTHIGIGAAKAADISRLETKSPYCTEEGFTGASMIEEEVGDEPNMYA